MFEPVYKLSKMSTIRATKSRSVLFLQKMETFKIFPI
jgi:hypothetical protein